MKKVEFKLENQNGEIISSETLTGKKYVLFFYPKASTPGCTQETREFSEKYDEFKKLGVEVIGGSKDPVKKQKKFSEKLSCRINLISDETSNLTESLEVWQLKKMLGKEYMGIVRSTFIINEKGEIEKEWRKVKVNGHVDEVLEYLKSKNN